MGCYDGSHNLTIRVVYEDDDMIEIAADLVADGWGGSTTAYTTRDKIARFTRDLYRFNKELSGEASLEAGADNGIGLVALRFYTLDRSRHVACHVRLASSRTSGLRPETIYKLAIELTTEPHFIGEFVYSLDRLARSDTDVAALIIE